MPSSVLVDGERTTAERVVGLQEPLDEHRALQMALEQLSLLGLDEATPGISNGIAGDGPSKRRNNSTECVAVPSSEHVAEIVGRQGCKIKALRAKTNTYIKTPVRGEEPVFVITGRQEDVAMAKREILSAAEHFSVIRASRNKPGGPGAISDSGTGPCPLPCPPNVPGQTTIQVRVPYRVVGLVVGPKGATIKRIQQSTHTYIVTPSRDKEPVFEVTGMPENVDRAREEIEAHIAVRTGGLVDFNDENDFHINGTDVGFEAGNYQPGSLWIRPPRKPFSNNRNDSSSSLGSTSTDLGSGRISTDFSPTSPYSSNAGFAFADSLSSLNSEEPGVDAPSYDGPSDSSSSLGSTSTDLGSGRISTDFSPTSPYSSNAGFAFADSLSSLNSEEPGVDAPSYDGPSVSQGSVPPAALLWAQFERTNPMAVLGATGALQARPRAASGATRLSPTFAGGGSILEHPLARRARSDPLNHTLGSYLTAPTLNGSADCSLAPGPGSSDPPDPVTVAKGRECSVCQRSSVTAALVPCGHNLFCMECAGEICQKSEAKCPVCRAPVTQAIQIFS
uniref:Mex-3 RNA binding family member B n=1 Tax=Eptatretus burgeri TaxID=7764 RepID=A0A8C4Q721_EPTBU